MHSKSTDFPDVRHDSAQSEEILMADYQQTFSTAHGQRVLADLALHSGFYTVRPIDVSNDVLREDQGQRRLFYRILWYVNMTPKEQAAIEQAARLERLSLKHTGDE